MLKSPQMSVEKESVALNTAIKKGHGDVVSQYYDIEFIYSHNVLFSQLCGFEIESKLTFDVWRESLPLIFQISLAKTEKEAFQFYNKATAPIIRSFKSLDTSVSVPVLKVIAKSLRYFANIGDYNESVNQMQKLLPLSLAHKNYLNGKSSFLSVANELICVYFMRNNFKQATNVIHLMQEKKVNFGEFAVGEVAEFHFNRGKVSAIMCQVYEAQADLTFALEHTPLSQDKNRKLILAYLVPVQMCCGIVPSMELLNKYDLKLYVSFTQALVNADLALFDEVLKQNQLAIIKLGQLDLMIRARQIVLLRILKITHAAFGDSKMPTNVFQDALSIFHPVAFQEAECILAGLIKEGFVKAYMSHPLKMIVFSKQAPFPSIETKQ